jgi:S1-C subfamily serine protease
MAEITRTERGRARQLGAAWAIAFLLLLLAGGASAAPDPANAEKGSTLGVVVGDLSFEQIDELGISLGVLVHSVVPDSPADQAGVEPGDIVIALDGTPVYSPQRLQWIMSTQPAGEPVTLSVRRGDAQAGEVIGIQVVPAVHRAVTEKARAARGGGERSWLGIQMHPMTDALRQMYQVPMGRGVLIADVEQDSPAAQAGLLPGDILLRFDRRKIRSLQDVYRALAFFDPGETVELEVIRGGQTKSLQATLGGKAMRGGIPLYPSFGHPDLQGPPIWMGPPPGVWPEGLEGLRDFLPVPPRRPGLEMEELRPGREIAL